MKNLIFVVVLSFSSQFLQAQTVGGAISSPGKNLADSIESNPRCNTCDLDSAEKVKKDSAGSSCVDKSKCESNKEKSGGGANSPKSK